MFGFGEGQTVQQKEETPLFDDTAGGDGEAAPARKTGKGGGSNHGDDGSNGNGANGEGGDGFSGDGSRIALHSAAQARYLNYALSVITSRALPDVRDGLKPVQRRILFAMWQQNLTFDAKHRKCAAVVGDVMGKYHPHGDSSIYDALVRQAQSFSLRVPLIDGSGNFGSLDGDNAAAMRYTECRLQRISDELLTELEQETVHFRPNYDGTKTEPVVLPARIPNLLLNGSTGIAVGMATNIPPHNLGELCRALLKLLADPDIQDYQLIAKDAIQGPDFPTGAQVLNSAKDLREIYKNGSGSFTVRGTWKQGVATKTGKTLIIDSIPYAVNKATLVEAIGAIVMSRKLPPLIDVRDVSTEDVRIELELKSDADEQMIMAYLCKQTALQSSFAVNMTCLLPTDNPELGRPERLGVKEILWHFLHFRLDVVTKRLEHELAQLSKRIHILEGFEKVFDALDEIIKIIRKSDGKADAAEKIMKRFELDAEQTDAILELKLYRLARLEILIIQQELEEKRKRVREINKLLKDEDSRWKIVKNEIEEILEKYGKLPENKRRTLIAEAEEEKEYTDEDFIVEEDNVVIVTRDGWVKRQKEIKDLATTRLREGDSVMAVLPGSTRATAVFFSNFGTAYTCRLIDIPATTGHGEPIQSLFKFKDGEKVVAAASLDPRVTTDIKPAKEGAEPRTHGVAVSSDGYALRFPLEAFVEVSTRAGRRFGRVKDGAEFLGVEVIHGKEIVIAATRHGHAMLSKVNEINYLTGPGRGVILIKIGKEDDKVIGFITATDDKDTLTVETSQGAERRINTGTYESTGRGGKGRAVLQRGELTRVIYPEAALPVMLDDGKD